MTQIPQIVNYLRSCYQADNRELSLFNFFNSKVESRLFLETPDLIEGKSHWFPVPTAWATRMEKKLKLYGKEKILQVGAFFILGDTIVAGERLQIYAPLLLHTLELFCDQEVYYLRFTSAGFSINPSAIRIIETEKETDLTELLLRALEDAQYLDFDAYDRLEQVLKEHALNLDVPDDLNLNHPLNEEAVKNLASKKNKDGLWLIPANAVALVDKPRSSRELVNELEKLATEPVYSQCLRVLLGEEKNALISKEESNTSFVPADFNPAQLRILKRLFRNPVNAVVGPPGTGKSFTIAGIAADCVAKGKTVLIAAQTDQAVGVIQQKIREDIGLEGVVMRGGSKRDYKSQLKKRLGKFLYGMGVPVQKYQRLKAQRNRVAKLNKEIKRLESIINAREQNELNWGALLLSSKKKTWWRRFKIYIGRKRWQRISSMAELIDQLENRLEDREQALRELVAMEFNYRLNNVLKYQWQDFQYLAKALKARTGNQKEDFFSAANFKAITQAIPVWLVNLNDVGQILPMQPELFDIAIVDEATQCNLASCLPVLQRARHALIVGDPKQLRHVSFLSRGRQNLLARKCGLDEETAARFDFRALSLMDLTIDQLTSGRQMHFLDEHYRSLPDIIQFSNQRFYENSLKIMSETPITRAQRNVSIHYCKGKRYKRGYNKVEAEYLLTQVAELMKKERELDDRLKQRIGILSPFREQANYLQKAIEKQFTLEQIQAHRLLVGTPYHFQGEERDVMFLSFVVDPDTHPSTFQYLNRADVFNVSITRARVEQKVFLSFSAQETQGKGLFFDYIAYLQRRQSQEVALAPLKNKDFFLHQVHEYLTSYQFDEIYCNYCIGNQEIDLLAVKNGRTYCIDLIGYPGPYGAALPTERYRQLSRMGLHVFPLTYAQWFWGGEEAERRLQAYLEVGEGKEKMEESREEGVRV